MGGTSWYSTVEDYRHSNQTVNDRYGDKPLAVFQHPNPEVYPCLSVDPFGSRDARSEDPVLKRLLRSAALLAALAAIAPAQIVISQIYGGGGNAGTTYKNDFIEIFNRGNTAQSLAGWSVQYSSAAGTTWAVTNLPAMDLQPGQYFLIQESLGAGGTVNLPTPDAIGTIAISATAGKVALVNSITPLAGACPIGNGLQDLIGFNSPGANGCSEGTTTAALTNTTAAIRNANGCADTDNNLADFTLGPPNPRNTSSPVNVCGVAAPLSVTTGALPKGAVAIPYGPFVLNATGGSGGYTWSVDSGTPTGLTLAANGALSGTPTEAGTFANFTVRVTDANLLSVTATLSVTIDAAQTCSPTHLIGQVQGTGSTSPVATKTVTTTGIVTGRKTNGFFIQSAPGADDKDPNTSDGVFVFTRTAPTAAATVGNAVCVTGLVQEFFPDPNGPSTTEIATPSYFSISTGNPLPAPVTISRADLPTTGPLDPLEKYEGMRVQFASLTVVSPTQGSINEANATSTSNGDFYTVLTGVPRPTREPGIQVGIPLPAGAPVNIPRFDFNPERLRVDSHALGAPALEVTTGVVLTNVVGILDYGFYTTTLDIDATNVPGRTANSSASPSATPLPEELTIASFNMERFFDTVDDPATSDVVVTTTAFNNRLSKASLAIRNSLNSPDILAVEEMENLATLQAVATKVNNDAVAAGQLNPVYQPYLVEGNDIGGINVGFLVKSAKVTVVDVNQFGKTATYVIPTNGQSEIVFDRPPLVLRATATATRPGSANPLPITVIVLHLRSLSGVDNPGDGPRIRAKRKAGADFVANLIQARQVLDPTENIAVLGDFNAFDVNDGYVDVTNTIRGVPAPPDTVVLSSPAVVNPTLTNVLQLVPADRRYSYTFDGDTQFLDQILVNQPLMTKFNRADIAHSNADFPESYRNDPTRPERISDHDMPVAYFTLPTGPREVTSQLTLSLGSPLYSPATRLFSTNATITNTSNAAIAGPLQFAFTNLVPGGVPLLNATGTANGIPYITVLNSGSLASGDSITFTMIFNAQLGTVITYTPKVFSGPF